MTDCSSIHGSTTSSSDIISSRGVTSNPRIRIIRMIRPNSRRVLLGPDSNSVFGFAIRGGREFGTGFFVSRVEKGSEADIKGLRIGDQIIRANGYNVDDAIHKELTQFISSQDRLTLKVRGVGMLPVKEKTVDPLSWHIVPRHTLTSITNLEEMQVQQKDVRIILKVAPRTKLGLGICKGPEWKPGIFVQFTKEFSVARDAGLRPGDQILSCNSIDFSDVLFSEAVAVMKSAQILEMVIRTGAGLDLFPGESSGYNSSASSVTGDQSPCWADQSSKRLSIVREENSLDKLGMQSKFWYARNSLGRRKNFLPTDNDLTHKTESDGNKTIIQLSDNGTLINNTLVSDINNKMFAHYQNDSPLNNITPNRQHNNSSSLSSSLSSSTTSSNEGNVKLNFVTPEHVHTGAVNTANESGSDKVNGKIADICFVSRQSETKTVIVEVHRSAASEETNRSSSTPATSAPVPPPKPPPILSNSSSSSDTPERSPSVASSSGTSSLGNAISEELKKRQERQFSSRSSNHNIDESSKKPSIDSEVRQQQLTKRFGNPSLGGSNDERRHSALMDEFKRAHRKMFKNGFQEDDSQERQAEISKAAAVKDETDNFQTGTLKTEINNSFPTPPPPPQFANNNMEIQKSQNYSISQFKTLNSPIETPTPDYDSTPTHTLPKNGFNTLKNGITSGKCTIERLTAASNEIGKSNRNGDIAELESIDSYKLQNPTSMIPKPPALYFAPQSSGPPTMKKTNRHVAVTIGEYGGQNIRKEPNKLDFISKATEINDKNHNNQYPQVIKDENNVSDKLRSELEKTLSRSNLKKRNDTSNTLNTGLNSNTNNDTIISNGRNSLPKGNHQLTNVEKLAHILQSKQQLSDNEMMNKNKSATVKSANKVTISIPSNKHELRSPDSIPPPAPPTPANGILKSCYTKSNHLGEKSIKFGN